MSPELWLSYVRLLRPEGPHDIQHAWLHLVCEYRSGSVGRAIHCAYSLAPDFPKPGSFTSVDEQFCQGLRDEEKTHMCCMWLKWSKVVFCHIQEVFGAYLLIPDLAYLAHAASDRAVLLKERMVIMVRTVSELILLAPRQ